MSSAGSPSLSLDTIVHRVGGAGIDNLRLSVFDIALNPAGISVLLGGTPGDAANQMRAAYPRSQKWKIHASTVASTTVDAIRAAGFDVMLDPTDRFPNHARLIHKDGVAGFSDANLTILAQVFHATTGC